MGQVALTYRLLPESADADMAALEGSVKGSLPAGAKVAGVEQKPFAFGLKALIVKIVVEDAEGAPDQVESALTGVSGVQGVELLDMGRLL